MKEIDLIEFVKYTKKEEVFLDDVTVTELSEYLQIPIEIVDSDGAILLDHVIR